MGVANLLDLSRAHNLVNPTHEADLRESMGGTAQWGQCPANCSLIQLLSVVSVLVSQWEGKSTVRPHMPPTHAVVPLAVLGRSVRAVVLPGRSKHGSLCTGEPGLSQSPASCVPMPRDGDGVQCPHCGGGSHVPPCTLWGRGAG